MYCGFGTLEDRNLCGISEHERNRGVDGPVRELEYRLEIEPRDSRVPHAQQLIPRLHL